MPLWKRIVAEYEWQRYWMENVFYEQNWTRRKADTTAPYQHERMTQSWLNETPVKWHHLALAELTHTGPRACDDNRPCLSRNHGKLSVPFRNRDSCDVHCQPALVQDCKNLQTVWPHACPMCLNPTHHGWWGRCWWFAGHDQSWQTFPWVCQWQLHCCIAKCLATPVQLVLGCPCEMFSETTEQDNKTADVSVFSKIYFYLFII